MSSSVRLGLEHLEAQPQVLEAAVLMPCDQPHLDAEVLSRLAAAHHASGQPIVVSGYGGIWGAQSVARREEVRGAFHSAAALKWAGHRMAELVPIYSNKEMISIGG